MNLNLNNLDKYLTQFVSVANRLKNIKEEVGKLQEEFGDYFYNREEWNLSSKNPPPVGTRVITGELRADKEAYNVVVYQSPDQLYKYWIKLDNLPE